MPFLPWMPFHLGAEKGRQTCRDADADAADADGAKLMVAACDLCRGDGPSRELCVKSNPTLQTHFIDH